MQTRREIITSGLGLAAIIAAGKAPAAVVRSMVAARRTATFNNNQEEEMYKELYLALIGRTISGVIRDENVRSVGISAFQYCSSITEIDLPNCSSLTFSSDGLSSPFAKMTQLQTAKLNSVATIGYNCFNGCSNLSTLYVNSATKFDDISFQGCNNLQNIYCQNLNTITGRTFGYLNSISNPITFHIGNKTSTTVLGWNLSSHFGNTPTSKWTLFRFECSDGAVVYDGTNWVLES